MTNSVKVCIQLLLLVWLQWFEFHLWREEIAKQAVHFYADENAEKDSNSFVKGEKKKKGKQNMPSF